MNAAADDDVRPQQRDPAAADCTPVRSADGAWHCVTCSDEGVPMRVEQVLDAGVARCSDEKDQSSDVLTMLVGEIAVGDMLLVHAGTALVQLRSIGADS